MGKSTKFAISRNNDPTERNGANKKSQYERFVETARELGADDSEKAFDEALRKIVKAKSEPPQPKK